MKRVNRTNQNEKIKSIIKTNNIRNGKGAFNFFNGDRYEGNYVVINNKEIYRQEYGIYKTSDGDEYRALWDKDCIDSRVHISYGNKAEYRGEIDSEGSMSGHGTYIFPDKSTLGAYWQDNDPVAEHVYTDPLGHRWLGKLAGNKQEIVFSLENSIWDFNVSN